MGRSEKHKKNKKQGRQNIEEDSWGCRKWQKSVILADWVKLVGENGSTGQCSSSRFKNREPPPHLQGMNRSSGSAYIRSPIGLANKLVQFKERPLYSCSLKAAYTHTKKRTYEKNLWYKEFFKTRKTSPWRLSPSCYTFIKEGVKRRREKERRSKVPQFFQVDVTPNVFMWAALVSPAEVTRSCLRPSLLQTENKITSSLFF